MSGKFLTYLTQVLKIISAGVEYAPQVASQYQALITSVRGMVERRQDPSPEDWRKLDETSRALSSRLQTAATCVAEELEPTPLGTGAASQEGRPLPLADQGAPVGVATSPVAPVGEAPPIGSDDEQAPPVGDPSADGDAQA